MKNFAFIDHRSLINLSSCSVQMRHGSTDWTLPQVSDFEAACRTSLSEAKDLECQSAANKCVHTSCIRNLYHTALSLWSKILSVQDTCQASSLPSPNNLTAACAERVDPANLYIFLWWIMNGVTHSDRWVTKKSTILICASTCHFCFMFWYYQQLVEE